MKTKIVEQETKNDEPLPELIDWQDMTGAGVPEDDATKGAEFGKNISGGGSDNNQVSNEGYATRYLRQVFGDGSDGDVTITSDTTLTRDMYYNNLTLNGGNLNAGGYRVFVKGTLTIYPGYKIHRNGNDGGVGTNPGIALTDGAIGGSAGGGNGDQNDGGAGSAGGDITHSLGGDGGKGGDSGSNVGWDGGKATEPSVQLRAIPFAVMLTDFPLTSLIEGGAGGGGGRVYGSGLGDAGAGGGGGGVLFIAARVIVNNGSIEAIGGNGGNGSNTSNPLNTAGGGGAGGGFIMLIYNSYSGNGTISVAGGIHGSGGTSDAVDGTAGTIIQLEV